MKKLMYFLFFSFLFYCAQAQNRASWMREAKWGVMIHYQAYWLASENHLDSITLEGWNKLIDNFDVEGLAEQLSIVGAGYLIITVTHAPMYFIAPNSMYDHYTGIQPSRCAKRDLVDDLYSALNKYNIKLIVYMGGPPPNRRIEEINGFAYDRDDQRKAEAFLRWQEVIREYSIRWGNKVSGWWFDGCYRPNTMFRYPDIPNFASMAAAARAGNPNSIITFNPGVFPRIMSMTPYEDYTAGEINEPDGIRFAYSEDGMIDGRQIHILSYLGQSWGQGNPRFKEEQIIEWSKNINKVGGAVTWDVPPMLNGNIPESFMKQLVKLGEALKTKIIEK